MKATRKGHFHSKGTNNSKEKGKLRYQYIMTGTEAEISAFQKQQGDYAIPNDNPKEAIWNQIEDHGQNPEVTKTFDGNFIIVHDELAIANEQAQMYPFLAEGIAKRAFAKLEAQTTQRVVSSKAPVAVVASEKADLGK